MSGLLVIWLASTWVPATRAHHHEPCSIRAERACIALALVSFAARAVLFRMRGAEVRVSFSGRVSSFWANFLLTDALSLALLLLLHLLRSCALALFRWEQFAANHPRLVSRGNLVNLLVWVASLYYYFLVDKVRWAELVGQRLDKASGTKGEKGWTKVGQRLDKARLETKRRERLDRGWTTRFGIIVDHRSF